jgi:L-methionine (R)-S-oxide reductase
MLTTSGLTCGQGFYQVVSHQMLSVGPYQGKIGCLRIPFARGVCGAAASQKATVLVPDVHEFPGHIACDGRWVLPAVVRMCCMGGAHMA